MGLTQEEMDALARAPKRTAGDEGSVEERDAAQAIQLDVYSKANQCAPPFGMCIARVAPRGTVPNS